MPLIGVSVEELLFAIKQLDMVLLSHPVVPAVLVLISMIPSIPPELPPAPVNAAPPRTLQKRMVLLTASLVSMIDAPILLKVSIDRLRVVPVPPARPSKVKKSIPFKRMVLLDVPLVIIKLVAPAAGLIVTVLLAEEPALLLKTMGVASIEPL